MLENWKNTFKTMWMTMAFCTFIVMACILFVTYYVVKFKPPVLTSDDLLEIEYDAKSFVAKFQGQGEYWTDSQIFPVSIKKLNPQYIQIVKEANLTLLNIQISGGFMHYGYFVICEGGTEKKQINKRKNWNIQKLSKNIYEYRE